MAKVKNADIKESLMSQLAASGKDTPYYRDLAEAYMELRKTREAFRSDIAKRGIYVKETDKWGTEWTKVNPSVAAHQTAVYKMAQLIKAMGLSEPIADEDEEL
jgi:hypothetical protein|nr:MAG TPA: terminase small subunit [Caudoviricetes sp.]